MESGPSDIAAGGVNAFFIAPTETLPMARVLAACVVILALGGCGHVARERPEAEGPLLRPGAWRLTQGTESLPWLCVGVQQQATQLMFAVGRPICMAEFRWRREGESWRFESRCAYGDWEQVADGRAVGDFQTSFAFTARVRGRGFEDSTLNGESIVRVQGRYRGRAPCR